MRLNLTKPEYVKFGLTWNMKNEFLFLNFLPKVKQVESCKMMDDMPKLLEKAGVVRCDFLASRLMRLYHSKKYKQLPLYDY